MSSDRGTVVRHRRSGSGALRWLLCQALAVANAALVSRGAALAFTQAQADNGQQIYQRQCAQCHGPHLDGKGKLFNGLRAPPLAGDDSLPCEPRRFQTIRSGDFRTAKDVYEFVSAIEPPEQPASLFAEQYWNVLAFLLLSNGKSPDGTRLDATSGGAVILHADCPAPTQGTQP